MDEEYPDQGTQDEGQDPYAERAWARAPVTAESQPSAVGLPSAGDLPPTGDDRVDAAVAGLSRLPGTPADEHVAVLEEVHGRLRDILGELNEGPDRPDLAQGRP
jgi:hypothetical protein